MNCKVEDVNVDLNVVPSEFLKKGDMRIRMCGREARESEG
jgi:hypothetical protein